MLPSGAGFWGCGVFCVVAFGFPVRVSVLCWTGCWVRDVLCAGGGLVGVVDAYCSLLAFVGPGLSVG